MENVMLDETKKRIKIIGEYQSELSYSSLIFVIPWPMTHWMGVPCIAALILSCSAELQIVLEDY